VGDLLAAEGIVLEQRGAPAGGVSGVARCVIPRHDIPFDSPGAGEVGPLYKLNRVEP
jgi:hypothetical protein